MMAAQVEASAHIVPVLCLCSAMKRARIAFASSIR